MTHLWLEDSQHRWAVAPLFAPECRITELAELSGTRLTAQPGAEYHQPRLLLHAASRSWVLIVPARQRVLLNGRSLGGRIAVLRDRDELVLLGGSAAPSRRMFFSTETRARVQPYTGPDGASCPRCKLPMVQEQPAVACPCCQVWHHQQQAEGGTECWTYADTCAACHAQETALDAGFRWTPDDL